MTKVADYRQILRNLETWQPFLLAESGLPGPRGNMELAKAVAEEGDEALLQIENRRSDDFLALRKGLAYCWSVAVAAHPEAGKPMMERWCANSDQDVHWVMRQNLRKKRLARLDPQWVTAWQERLAV